ncbi:MAG: TGS domain-containing protein, partial [Nitrososphaerota archaeon]|nr:TGS domain-containing protein [Nitrososphaerota archaeon]
DELLERLSGLGVRRSDYSDALRRAGLEGRRAQDWSADDTLRFASEIRKACKPMLVAANKCDLPGSRENVARMSSSGRLVVPASAAAELVLLKARQKGMIEYTPGDAAFRRTGALTQEQERALAFVEQKVLGPWGGTGIQKAISEAYFGLLGGVVVYPVEDENRFSDKSGKVLPDVHIVPAGSTARDLAYRIHGDLGEGFLYAVDAKKKLRLGADYRLKDGDVVKIVSAAKRG